MLMQVGLGQLGHIGRLSLGYDYRSAVEMHKVCLMKSVLFQ